MLDKKEKKNYYKKLDKISVKEIQKLICQALDESGIEYTMDGTGISLSGFFESFYNDIKEHLNELKNINN